jgi:hypothetical protein
MDEKLIAESRSALRELCLKRLAEAEDAHDAALWRARLFELEHADKQDKNAASRVFRPG